MELGDRIKQARLDANMTQSMLARISGVTQARISALELNKNKKSSCLIQLGHAMGVDPAWLETGIAATEVKVDYTPLEKELLRLIMGLSDDDRAREISYIQKLAAARL